MSSTRASTGDVLKTLQQPLVVIKPQDAPPAQSMLEEKGHPCIQPPDCIGCTCGCGSAVCCGVGGFFLLGPYGFFAAAAGILIGGVAREVTEICRVRR